MANQGKKGLFDLQFQEKTQPTTCQQESEDSLTDRNN